MSLKQILRKQGNQQLAQTIREARQVRTEDHNRSFFGQPLDKEFAERLAHANTVITTGKAVARGRVERQIRGHEDLTGFARPKVVERNHGARKKIWFQR